jgi:UDP-GlcNAc:undecaprenyl-phosphate/decaprenyl-phosphate GlcNAc-1-phosphate transferase
MDANKAATQFSGLGINRLTAHIPTLIALFASAFIALLLCVTARWHGQWTSDSPASGPQKLHRRDTPRVGGVAIMISFVAALLVTKIGTDAGQAIAQPLGLIVALAVPFAAGLYEDVTQSFGVTMRLLATFVAALIAYYLCGAVMTRFDVPPLDAMLQSFSWAPLLFTMFCVGGIAHAFNLSDGLNGLLGGLTLIACAVLGYTARGLGDMHVYFFVCALAGATLGFLIFNYPRARLFAGDSGAYVIGTAIALFAILLVARNASVTPWIAFVAVLYPFTDTTFAIMRRAAQRRPVMQPDAEHLHSLVLRRLVAHNVAYAHALATLFVLLVTALFSLAAMLFAHSTVAVALCCALFAATYVLAWFACSEYSTTSLENGIPTMSGK